MEISSKILGGTLYISLDGELDEHSAMFTRNTLDELFEKNSFRQVVMDLNSLDFVDSTGVGVLIGRYKKLKGVNKQIYISNPSPHAEKIFVMSGIYSIMPKVS